MLALTVLPLVLVRDGFLTGTIVGQGRSGVRRGTTDEVRSHTGLTLQLDLLLLLCLWLITWHGWLTHLLHMRA